MPGVKADILAKVVEFMQHHKGVEPPILEKPLRSKVRRCSSSSRAQIAATADGDLLLRIANQLLCNI